MSNENELVYDVNHSKIRKAKGVWMVYGFRSTHLPYESIVKKTVFSIEPIP